MSKPLRPDTLGGRHHVVERGVIDERQKPNLRGFRIFVGTFVAAEDPGNDPQDLGATPPIDTSPSSPEYQNNLTYLAGSPVWFAHGLDGETDMGGMYDFSQGYVYGDVGFVMPLEWAEQAEPVHVIPVKVADGVYMEVVQEITLTVGGGEVRFWPVYAYDLVP